MMLPRPSSLSENLSKFLDDHIETSQRLSPVQIQSLIATVKKHCGDVDADLSRLEKKLSLAIASFISSSSLAHGLLYELRLKLDHFHDPLLPSAGSSGDIYVKRIRSMLDKELPLLVKEMHWIENVRMYTETTLQLEVLVGDLEDTVFSIMTQISGNTFSIKLPSTSNSTNFDWKQEKLQHFTKVMKDIEDVLVRIVKSKLKWSHLLKIVDSRVDKALGVLRPQALADHRSLLSSLGWPPPLLTSTSGEEKTPDLPNPLLLMQGDKKDCYSRSFLTLCALQYMQVQRECRQHDLGKPDKGHQVSSSTLLYDTLCLNYGLWTIDELVFPIASRMEHHFSSWLDQPKFIFALVYRITRDFIGVDDVLQPLIDKARLVGFSAREAWVSGMVKMLSGYLTKRVFSQLAQRFYDTNDNMEVNSSWIHFVDLIISFDKQMQELAHFGTHFIVESLHFTESSKGVSTLATMFNDRPDWIVIWADIELKDAEDKLMSELGSDQIWMVDVNRLGDLDQESEADKFLLSTREEYKAPLVVDTVLRIAWTMVERSRTLPDVLLQVHFIKSSAVRFLREFLQLLAQRCQKIDHADFHANENSLLILASSINAARYCKSVLQEWGEDIEFLDMVIVTDDTTVSSEDEPNLHGCFFRDEVEKFMQLENELLEDILAFLLRKFDILCWYYVQNREQWERGESSSINSLSDVVGMTVTADFIEALDDLRERLQVLKKGLNSNDFLDLWRVIAGGLDHFILQSIPLSDVIFSAQGIKQFKADMLTLFSIFRPFCVRPEAFFPCISDVIKLLEMDREQVLYLQEVLSQGDGKVECLHVHGVHHVSPAQAEKILLNRKVDA